MRSSLALLLAVQICTASATSYTLHHRIGSGDWSKRGVIRSEDGKEGQTSFAIAPQAYYEDLTGSLSPWESLTGYDSATHQIYQLALTPENVQKVDDLAPITFTRLCYLSSKSDESITLHTDENGTHISGLGYELIGLDSSQLGPDGCPKESNKSTKDAKQVIINVEKPQEPLSLQPPAAPPTKPDGTPLAPGEEPPKEQSFFRKYWYYILPVVVMMIIPTELADANNEAAESDEGGGGGSGQGARLKSGRGGGPAPVGAARQR